MTAQFQPELPESVRTAHPQVAEALGHLQRFQSVLEEALATVDNGVFKGSDEHHTVEVTVNGRCLLSGLYLEDGVMRLGAAAVQERINAALTAAALSATESLSAQAPKMFADLADITGTMKKGMGLA